MKTQITGIVKRVFFKALTTPDRFNADNKFQRSVQLTSVKGVNLDTMEPVSMEGEPWVSLGNCKTEAYNIKVGAGWHEVAVGDKLSMEVEASEYNGKTYYKGKGVKLVEAAAVSAANATPSNDKKTPWEGKSSESTPKKSFSKDMTGISTGHALNGAFRFLKEDGRNLAEVVAAACEIHIITESLKAEVRKRYPEMSEYDSGAMTGHAILNACDQAKNIEDIKRIANNILAIVPLVQGYIKTGNLPEGAASISDSNVDEGEYQETSVLEDVPF